MNRRTARLALVTSLVGLSLTLSACTWGVSRPEAGDEQPSASVGTQEAGPAPTPETGTPTPAPAEASLSTEPGSGAAAPSGTTPAAETTDAETTGAGAPASSATATQGATAPTKATQIDTPTVKAEPDAAAAVPKSMPKTYRKAKAKEDAGVETFLKGTAVSGKPAASSKEDVDAAAAASAKVLHGLAVGAALEELKTEYMNNAVNNRTVSGTPVVKGTPRTVDLDGGLTRVFVCLDSSQVEVKVGSVIETPRAPAGTRTAVNVYDLRKHGDAYLVERHSFTDDPGC